jgi:hypothetical protein
MQLHHARGRAKLGLATVLAVGIGLASITSASAAPGDNLRNARQCLRGGWHSLQTSSGRSFRGPISCVLYAFRGGTLVAVGSTPAPGPVPDPDPVPDPGGE